MALRIAICNDELKVLNEVSHQIKNYADQRGRADLEVCPFNSASSLVNSIDIPACTSAEEDIAQ